MYNGCMNEHAKVIGYVRVSSLEQGESGAGLDSQRQAITDECARRGWQLERIEEDVLSARNMRRPGLQRALADCRSGVVQGIVAAKLDRLSRSVIDFSSLLNDARKRGYNIVALDLGVDLSTPQGEFAANIVASVSQWERQIIGERTKAALAVKKSQGVVLGRPRIMSPEVRERIFSEREAGNSLRAIADGLTADGVPTSHGGTWRASTIQSVLGS